MIEDPKLRLLIPPYGIVAFRDSKYSTVKIYEDDIVTEELFEIEHSFRLHGMTKNYRMSITIEFPRQSNKTARMREKALKAALTNIAFIHNNKCYK